MVKREEIEVDITGNWFINGKREDKSIHLIFNAEPNIVEKTAIKNDAAELLGGREKVVQLEQQAFSFYEKHIEYNKKKHGEEEFTAKLTEIERLKDLKTDGEILQHNKLFKEIYKNQYYEVYAGLMEDRVRLGGYAFLKVMCKNKPEGFEFFAQQEDELQKIVKEVETKRKFFRQAANKHTADSSSK